MSLATLKRKTKATAPRFSKNKCFVLNMTGRGTVVGQSSKYSSCQNNSKQCCVSGTKSSYCTNVEYMAPACEKCPSCWRLNKPAPQMGYGVYINQKAKGAYRPSGSSCNSTKCHTSNKPVWKLTTTYDASLVIEKKKTRALHCDKNSTPLHPISGKPTSNAKPCIAGIKQRKCDHTNKNKKWCNNITKDLGGPRTASEQITLSKALSLSNVCIPTTKERVLSFTIENGKIFFIQENSSCKRPIIIRGFPYKISFQIKGETSIKIYTNTSNNPLNMCDVFYENDSKSNSFQINKLTVSASFCPSMNPILYFETTVNKISINISKSYNGYGLIQPRSGIKQCH